MEDSYFKRFVRLVQNRAIWIGGVIGVVAILFSILIRPVTLYRHIIDPLHLIQPLFNLRFGLLHFNWILVLNHLIYLAGLGLLTTIAARMARVKKRDGAATAAKAAGITTVGYIFWMQVDALVLVMWYGVAAYISIGILVWLTRRFDRMLFIPNRIR